MFEVSKRDNMYGKARFGITDSSNKGDFYRKAVAMHIAYGPGASTAQAIYNSVTAPWYWDRWSAQGCQVIYTQTEEQLTFFKLA